jgi:hypothetical protein
VAEDFEAEKLKSEDEIKTTYGRTSLPPSPPRSLGLQPSPPDPLITSAPTPTSISTISSYVFSLPAQTSRDMATHICLDMMSAA